MFCSYWDTVKSLRQEDGARTEGHQVPNALIYQQISSLLKNKTKQKKKAD